MTDPTPHRPSGGASLDFNDLAAAAGHEAVRRQIEAAVSPLGRAQPLAHAEASPDGAARTGGRLGATAGHSDAADLPDDGQLRAPPVLSMDAMPRLMRDIVEAACRSSEAHPVAVAANVLAMYCAAVGRVPFQRIGDGRIHCRPFVLVVGRSGKARKGTAETTAREVLRRADGILRRRHGSQTRLRVHAGGLSTGEGIAWAIRDAREPDEKTGKGGDAGVLDKRLLVIEPEFSNVLAQVKRDGNTLSATVRNLWDGRDLEPLTKTSQVTATRPHVVVVGHITGFELVEKSSENDAANGLLNRHLLLHVHRPKLVPLPEPTPAEELDALAARLADAIDYVSGPGRIPATNTWPTAVRT